MVSNACKVLKIDKEQFKRAILNVPKHSILFNVMGNKGIYNLALSFHQENQYNTFLKFNSVSIQFIYIAPNYNNCHLKAL